MPTLRNRSSQSGYCVRWKPHPDHERPSTYQINSRALRLFRTLDYTAPNPGDEATIPHDLCRPLRILGDLHFNDEGSVGNVELTDVPRVDSSYAQELGTNEQAALKQYIEGHPRFTSEKESELDGELSNLSFDEKTVDIDLGGDVEGPAANVDVDVNQLLGGNSSPIDEDLIGIVERWLPNESSNSGGQYSDREEYLEQISQLDHYRQSIEDFRDHSREIHELKPGDNSLIYKFEVKPSETGWMYYITDGRYDEEGSDLLISISNKGDTETIHIVTIDDHQFTSWLTFAGDEKVADDLEDSDLEPAEYHRILHDRANHLYLVEEFIEDLQNYHIAEATSW